ncbi:MAG: FAD-binding protein [Actinomycetota bacterium]|nr:FAD-binding protein [Actinomycetota bacterium]
MTRRRNWAGNYEYRATDLRSPKSVDELQELVAGTSHIRALGSRHCFNDIADTDGVQVSLAELPRRIDIDAAASTVTVDGGITYGQLAPVLQDNGWALSNLASLPHISVAGACATATHGSGTRNQNLAAAVAGMDLVTASGEIRSVRRGDQDFDGLPVGLGAAGIASAITLDIVPTYDVFTEVFTGLPWVTLVERLDDITAAGYSVSVLPNWRPDGQAKAFVKQRVAESTPGRTDFFGAVPANTPLHLIDGMDAGGCTPQLGEAGPWYQRLPHFKLDFTPSAGEELQSEYLVPLTNGRQALQAIKSHAAELAGLALATEVRTVAADQLWLSSAYRRDCLAIHFTWVQDQPAVTALLARLEASLADLEARPHWGKLFTTSASRIRQLYPRLGDFADLSRRLDPNGTFSNDFTRRHLADVTQAG